MLSAEGLCFRIWKSTQRFKVVRVVITDDFQLNNALSLLMHSDYDVILASQLILKVVQLAMGDYSFSSPPLRDNLSKK